MVRLRTSLVGVILSLVLILVAGKYWKFLISYILSFYTKEQQQCELCFSDIVPDVQREFNSIPIFFFVTDISKCAAQQQQQSEAAAVRPRRK